MKILQFPILKIFIGFLIGLILSKFVSIPSVLSFLGLGFCVVVLVVIPFFIKRYHFLNNIFGLFTISASILTGISTAIIHKETLNQNHYIHQISEYSNTHHLHLVLNEKLKNSTKNYRYICFVKSIDNQKSFGKVILNVSKDSKIDNLKIGTILQVSGIVIKNKNPANPYQFDYSAYLENQEIYAQVYSKSKSIKTIGRKFDIWTVFSNFRNYIIQNLGHSSIQKEKLNVLIALVLGQQQDISHEVLQDYQYAGAIHVLSVSGLHVGFILLFITFLLKPIGNSKKASLIKLCIIIISLWSFAVLAGLLPSIVRSVTMFSFLAIGTHLKRSVNIFHTLISSILLILLFKPSFLFDIGFQLSYLAVFFILWLQPFLSQLWKPKNKIINYFWDIITVSFSAQLGTMPLSIYYFHQFPGLFFITNILILPLLGVIMAIGVITILLAAFNMTPFYIAKIIEFLITLLNNIVHWVASFDSFVLQNISFSKAMASCSYLLIILFIFWIKNPKFKHLSLLFISVIFLQFVFINQKFNTFHQEELVVFSSKENTLITKRKGKRVTIYNTNNNISKATKSKLLLQSYLVGSFCSVSKKEHLNNVLYFNHKKILIIDSSCVYTNDIHPDILIIIQSPKLNLERALEALKPEQVIVDGTNYKSYTSLWEATCAKEKIPFHNVYEKGFYKL